MGRLSGRIALVTGGARGLGLAFVQRLAKDGADVAIADLDDAAEGRALVERSGRRAFSAPCDVGDPVQVEAFCNAAVRALGPIDTLVNNAGIYPTHSIEDLTLAEWRRIHAINLDSAFLLSKQLIPSMKERGFGRIVNISSSMLWTSVPNHCAYLSTKAACIGFTRGLASDVGNHGITVNAIAPSLIRHPGTESSHLGGLFDMVSAARAIQRDQYPNDLVGTLSFLVSQDAAFMTGQTLVLDGGA